MTLLTALIAVAAPVVIAIYLAHLQALQHASTKALTYAQDSLARSEMTTAQIADGISKLRTIDAKPCSEASIDIMREIDLASSYIQAIGYVSGNEMVCSSLEILGGGIDLGPVDVVNRRGVSLRIHTRLPFAKNDSFLVVEKEGYAAIIHKGLPIDTSTDADVSLATFTLDSGPILAHRGHIDPSWLTRPANDGKAAFRDKSHVVAVTRSATYLIGTIAAVPDSYLKSEFRKELSILLPLGILCSLLFAVALRTLINYQQSMPSAIRAALKRREFFLVYQPVVDLDSGRWVGAEALIRWRRANGEMVRPDHFIPVAEESGLISRVTEQVIDMAANDLGALFVRYPGFKVSINFSAADLASRKTIDLLRHLKASLNTSPGNLVVEATETSFMGREITGPIIHDIRAMGIEVAIDDFGTGYASLSYLETLEFDYLKIDKSFVDSLNKEASTSQVVHHIIAMGRALNIRMIAEGVETADQADYLRQQGVQCAQGWLFAKPMPLADLITGLATHG